MSSPWDVALLSLACLLCPTDATAHTPVLLAGDHPAIAYTGYFDRSVPQAPRFAWPASQVRVQFTGPGVRLHLTDTASKDETPENDWLSVEVDGGNPYPLRLQEGKHTYWIGTRLARDVHSLVLTKRTEAEVGTVTLHAIELSPSGQLLPAPAPARRIAVIGDSISAGYGIEGSRSSCSASAQNQDATRTYASIAARELGAELVVSAWSGKGVSRNYQVRDTETMPRVWERSVPTDRDAGPNPPDRAPDVVVVHLGTNDFMRGIPDESAFLGAYRALLQRIDVRYPQASLALVLSPLVTEQYPHAFARSTLARWLMTLKSERVARGRRTLMIEQSLEPREGLGCVAHPSLQSQTRLGRELAQSLRKQIAW